MGQSFGLSIAFALPLVYYSDYTENTLAYTYSDEKYIKRNKNKIRLKICVQFDELCVRVPNFPHMSAFLLLKKMMEQYDKRLCLALMCNLDDSLSPLLDLPLLLSLIYLPIHT